MGAKEKERPAHRARLPVLGARALLGPAGPCLNDHNDPCPLLLELAQISLTVGRPRGFPRRHLIQVGKPRFQDKRERRAREAMEPGAVNIGFGATTVDAA